jgi:uncharacterized delta-60 repeat protein
MRLTGIVARHGVACALAAGLALCALPASASADAEPDPAFGDGGFTTTPIPGAAAVAYDGAILSNGKIVVAGQASAPSGTGQIVVARYLPDGSPDPAFGTDGVFMSEMPTADGPFVARAVRQQAPGRKILVAGGYGQGSILLMRLTHTGLPDTTFGAGDNGIATLPVGGIAGAMAVAGDRLLVGAADGNDNGQPMLVAAFTADGRLDTSYGDDGVVKEMFWNPMMAASAGTAALRATPAGGVIGMGHLDYIGGDGHGSAGIFELDPSGDPVTAFGTGGHVEVDYPVAGSIPAFWFPAGITVDRQGQITAAGASTNYGGSLLAARLTPSGELDDSFGQGNGRAIVGDVGDGGNYPTSGVARTGGGTLTAGIGPSLIQLRANGKPRPRFGPRGTIDIEAPANVAINAVRRLGRRQVIVAGSAGNDLYVARYVFPAPQR